MDRGSGRGWHGGVRGRGGASARRAVDPQDDTPRQRHAPRRVMVAWDADSDASGDENKAPTQDKDTVQPKQQQQPRSEAKSKKKNKKKSKKQRKDGSDESGNEDEAFRMTDSDFERLEIELDEVVELAAAERFAGTMIVDADDVVTKRQMKQTAREKQARAVESNKEKAKAKAEKEVAPPTHLLAATSKKNPPKPQKKGSLNVDVAVVAASEPAVSQAATPETHKTKKTKAKTKKTRVTVVVTEDTVLEVVQLDHEAGQLDDGSTVQVTVASKKAKKKTKAKAVTTDSSSASAKNSGQVDALVVKLDGASIKDAAKPKAKSTAKPASSLSRHETEAIEKSESKKSKSKMTKKHGSSATTDIHDEAVDPLIPSKAKQGKSKAAPVQAPLQSGEQQEKRGKYQRDVTPGSGVQRPDFYENYHTRQAVMDALERGELYQGKLRVNPQFRMRAFLTVEGIPVDILVDGMKDRNRAMDGDLVAIALLPEDKWKPLKETKKRAEDDDASAAARARKREQNVDSEEKVAERAQALHALWRPTLDASRCFLPQSSATGSTGGVNKSAILTNARSVYEKSVELNLRPTGKVVFILATGNAGEGFVGSLEPKTRPTEMNAPLPADDDFAYFNAQDERIPRRIRIPRLQLPDAFVRHPLRYAQDMLCFCRITKWSVRHESPMGEFVKTLGEYSGIESGISAILMKHGLLQHTLDFRREILDELDEQYGVSGEKWEIPADELARRRDFRDYQIFSIDPYNARDLDDALHIRALNTEETQFEVGVHIADVTHFISKGSLLDQEAQQRATSVYLANRVLPMLPRILCERLCSLQPQVDRLAFSVVWQMNADGSLVEGCVPWFGKSIIRSCCKLDYGTAQRMLDGTVTSDKLDEWELARRPIDGDNAAITSATVIQSVRYLWLVAQSRRATRFDTGAVTLQDVKLVFSLDAKGNPTTFGTYQLKDSNRLVEEYMLLANYLVAQRLLQAHGPLAFIRRHPEPNERALETTLAILSEQSIEIDGSSPKRLSESLDHVRASLGDVAYGMVQNLITKPMKPAEYVVAGNAGSEAGWRHYALNIPYYTHFTSPIRRYADVVVHRLLQESIVDSDTVASRVALAAQAIPAGDGSSGGEELTKLMHEHHSVAQNCNDKKMTSKNAEKEADQVFLCAYVQHNGAVEVTGVVVSSGQRSFTVYISELGLEKRLELKALGISGSWNEESVTLSLFMGHSKKSKKSKGKTVAISGTTDASRSQGTTTVAAQDGTGEGQAPPEPVQALVPELIELKFMTRLRLRMTTTNKMPLALEFAVLGELKG